MKAPASASALRPASSFAFHRGQARAARQRFAGVAQTHDQRDREPTPGTVAADGDVRRRDFLPAQEPPGSGGILKRRRKLVLRRQAIAHSQGADAGCPARFAHHAPVAGDGAGAIAAAMKEHQDAGSIASRPIDHSPARPPPRSTASKRTSLAGGQTVPTSSRRARRSTQPTGLGLAPSSARMAPISGSATLLATSAIRAPSPRWREWW